MNIKYSCRKWLGFVGVILFTIHCSLFLVSCSENSDTEEEYAQWQEKNDAYIQKLAASSMPKYLTYSKNTTISGADATDYVYVEVLESGSGEPYTDGYVFDQTYLGDFDWTTAGTTKFSPGESGLRDGFSTALQNMRVGDRWRVHFSYKLGYGTADYSDIPGYSDLVFDIAVYDIWHPGEKRPAFK